MKNQEEIKERDKKHEQLEIDIDIAKTKENLLWDCIRELEKQAKEHQEKEPKTKENCDKETQELNMKHKEEMDKYMVEVDRDNLNNYKQMLQITSTVFKQ